jgi:hypothetical protein
MPPAAAIGLMHARCVSRVRGEGLTRGTAGEERKIGPLENLGNLLGSQIADICLKEPSSVIRLEGKCAIGVFVHAQSNIDSCPLKAMG